MNTDRIESLTPAAADDTECDRCRFPVWRHEHASQRSSSDWRSTCSRKLTCAAQHIMERAVERGQLAKEQRVSSCLGVDEQATVIL